MQAPFADPLSGLELLHKTLPLVGREAEMQVIHVLLDTVARDLPIGARALTISGEMGVGKTRLLAEMYSEASVRGFRVLEGSAYESGSTLPYFPFIEVLRPILRSTPLGQLRRYLGLDSDEREATSDGAQMISLVGTPLVAALARLFPDLPRLLHVTIIPEVLSPDQEKFRLLDAVATLLERMALEQPVLLGLDNLQWADSASLELTLYLTVRLHSSQVALVGVTRPPRMLNERIRDREMTTASTTASAKALGDLMRHGLLLLLPLSPLNTHAAAQHLQALLPGTLSESLIQTLLTRAEGNPFFLEELVRTLTLNQQLVLRDGVWRATRVIGTALPESITLAVEQRLQGLSESCRELLRVASLFGRTFPLDALVKVLAESEEKVQSLIDEATQATVIATAPVASSIWDEYAEDGDSEIETASAQGERISSVPAQDDRTSPAQDDRATPGRPQGSPLLYTHARYT